MNKKRNISGSNTGAKKRPNSDVEKSDPKNIGVYKHSTDNWKIKINEDSWAYVLTHLKLTFMKYFGGCLNNFYYLSLGRVDRYDRG